MRTLVSFILALITVLGIQAENRALLVGIGKYKAGTGWSTIHGDSDVDLIAPGLKSGGYVDIVILKNGQATKSAIIKELQALASRSKKGDKVYFHFSGHGQPVSDLNGDEGEKGFDESIVPYDAYKTITSRIGNRFYNGENHLTDDELNPLFAAIKNKLGHNGAFFIAIDACYSDDMERAPDDQEEESLPTRGTSDKLIIKESSTTFNLPKPKPYSKGAKMYVVSACKSNERNFEYRTSDGKLYGSLSYSIYFMLSHITEYRDWCNEIEVKKSPMDRIFKHYQHPQVSVYK